MCMGVETWFHAAGGIAVLGGGRGLVMWLKGGIEAWMGAGRPVSIFWSASQHRSAPRCSSASKRPLASSPHTRQLTSTALLVGPNFWLVPDTGAGAGARAEKPCAWALSGNEPGPPGLASGLAQGFPTTGSANWGP